MPTTVKFDDYVSMIRKKAHDYSKAYNVDYEEVEAEGFAIYCECVKSHNPSKGSFSTYLWSELRRLRYFCIKYVNDMGGELSEEAIDYIESPYNNVTFKDILEDASYHLSERAMEMFKWILERKWERKGVRLPSPHRAELELGFSRGEAKAVWNEIKEYWNTEGECSFC